MPEVIRRRDPIMERKQSCCIGRNAEENPIDNKYPAEKDVESRYLRT